MSKRWLEIGCLFVAFGLLFTQHASAMLNEDDLAVLNRLGFFAQTPPEPQLSIDGQTLYNGGLPLVIFADPNPSPEPVRIPPPIDLLTAPESATATFSITYIANGGADPWGNPCITFPDTAKAAFNAAASIWGNILQSSVPITINACWGTNFSSSSILGYSGGAPLHRNFTGAPLTNTWYDGSLANALAGSDLAPGSFDMNITYNPNFAWYYGTDGVTPAGQYDLVSVVLHEIAHGLDFSGSMNYSGTSGSWGSSGSPIIYDTFIKDGSGKQLINTGVYANPSTALGTALTSSDIWFHGSNAMAANGGSRVKIYAPSPWASGSSYAHLDYSTFQGTVNRLMVYAISSGVSTHDPGPVTKGLLKDLGWNVVSGGSPTIQIVSPNGGEDWTVGSTHPITWTSANLNPAGGIYGYYWYNGAWNQIFGPLSTSSTSHSWTIPSTPTTSAYVYVGNWANNAWEVSDQSNQAFTIIGNFIYVAQVGQCGGNNPCIRHIQDGIASASAPSLIKISQETYNENITLNSGQLVILQGGWDTNFTLDSSATTLHGSITISNGKMILDKIIVK